MPVSGVQVIGRLESAVSFTLTRTVYNIIKPKKDTSILLLTCVLLYMQLHLLEHFVSNKIVSNILSRCTIRNFKCKKYLAYS